MADYDYRSRSSHIEVVKGNEFSSQAYSNHNIGTTSTNNTSGSNFSEVFSNHHGGSNDNNGNYNGGKNSRSKSAKSWSFSDPEVKRRKRVASYKVYSVEGKMKASFLKSYRWIKDKYSGMVQGW